MEAIPIGLFWSIAIWTLCQRKHALLYLFFASMPFGSFAAIPTALTGGMTLTPTPIIAALLIARQLGSARGLRIVLNAALRPSALLLLSLFWLVAAIVTVFMPRFFAGEIEVVTVALALIMTLAPTPQNFSQLVYISLSVMSVFAFASLLREENMWQHVLSALCLGAGVTVLTGALDFASQYIPLQLLLEPFRTAAYALLTDVEIADGKRVVGLMPEASAFGGLVLTFLSSLYFFRRAMPTGRLRDRGVPTLMVMLLLLVWVSTSSAAYLGLGFLGLAAMGEWCWRLLSGSENPYLRRGLFGEFWLGAFAIMALLFILIATPQLLAPMIEAIDQTVLQKTSSSSFEERSMWTQVSWDALMATHGLGVGLGGTRASNFAVALASNAGLLAAALYFCFVLQCLVIRGLPRGDRVGRALLAAVRWTYLAPFLASLTIGTTPDFGLFNAFLYGFALAITGQMVATGTRSMRDRQKRAAHVTSMDHDGRLTNVN